MLWKTSTADKLTITASLIATVGRCVIRPMTGAEHRKRRNRSVGVGHEINVDVDGTEENRNKKKEIKKWNRPVPCWVGHRSWK